MKILIINGPNLNMLGIREPDIYGSQDFRALQRFIYDSCKQEGIEPILFQSNHEGAIVDRIQALRGRVSDRSPIRVWHASKASSVWVLRDTVRQFCS